MNNINCTSLIRIHLMYNDKKATAFLFCDNGQIKKHIFKENSDTFFTKSCFIHECLTQPTAAKCLEKLDEGFYFYDAQHKWAEKVASHKYYGPLSKAHNINFVSMQR